MAEKVCQPYVIRQKDPGYIEEDQVVKTLIIEGRCLDTNRDGISDRVQEVFSFEMPDGQIRLVNQKIFRWPEEAPMQSILVRNALDIPLAQRANQQAQTLPLYTYDKRLAENNEYLRIRKLSKAGSSALGLDLLQEQSPDLLRVLDYAASEAEIPSWILIGMALFESKFSANVRNYNDCSNPSKDPAQGWSGGIFQIKDCNAMSVWDVITGRHKESSKPMRLKYIRRMLAAWEKVVKNKDAKSPVVDAFDWDGLSDLTPEQREIKLSALVNRLEFRSAPGGSVLADSLAAAFDIAFSLEFLGMDLSRYSLNSKGRLSLAGMHLQSGDELKFLMILRAAYNAGIYAVQGELFVKAFNRIDLNQASYVTFDHGSAQVGDLDLKGTRVVHRPDGETSIMLKYLFNALVFVDLRQAIDAHRSAMASLP